MSEHSSSSLYGGEEMGMTNEQYKGLLLDQLADLKRILKLAETANGPAVVEEVENQITKVTEKMKF